MPVLLVCLHEDAEKEHHTPISIAVQACFELGAGPLLEWRRRDEENKVHPHVVVMASKGFAVKEVFVTYVKAAEDMDLPVLAITSTLGTTTMLHAPPKPSNITAVKLFV